MSIIQEALKKVQNQIEEARRPYKKEEPKQISTEKPSFKVKATTSQKITPKFIMPFLLIAFIASSILIARQFAFKGGFKPKGSTKAAQDAMSHQEITYKSIASLKEPYEAKPAIEPIYDKKPSDIIQQRPNFVLNGIMYLNDEPRAIINNSVVTEGDTVGGAKVLKINKNNVVLNLDDLEITLSLKK